MMNKKVLIVAKSIELSMKFLADLKLAMADVTVVRDSASAIKHVRRNDYDLIIMGDRLVEGDTQDVALEIKSGRKNKKVPVVCVGPHTGRALKVVKLLGTYAVHTPAAEDKEIIRKVRLLVGEPVARTS